MPASAAGSSVRAAVRVPACAARLRPRLQAAPVAMTAGRLRSRANAARDQLLSVKPPQLAAGGAQRYR